MDRRTALKVAGVSIAVPVIEGVTTSAEVIEHTKAPLLVVLRHPNGTVVMDDKEVSVRDLAIEVAERIAIAIHENTGHVVAAVTLPPGYDIEVIEDPTPSD